METAKVFMTGRSQAVRLPRKYRFEGTEVEIRRKGDSVILTPISKEDALKAFLAMPCCLDFEIERGAAQKIQKRKEFP